MAQIDSLVSVIMPAYNAEKTIGRAIESVLQQTYSNWELIIVNDGSTDTTLEVVSKYKDSRLKVVNQTNTGLSGARNAGLDSAKGDYITFIDSDDWYEQDFLSQLMMSLTKNRAELCVCGVIFHKQEGISFSSAFDVSYDSFFDNREFLSKFEDGIMNSVWNKIYKAQVIKANIVRFRDILILEDLDFNLRYLECTHRLSFIPLCLYNYDNTSSVLTTKVSKEMFDNYIHIHAWFLSKVPINCFSIVSRFVYHQYMAFSIKYLKQPIEGKMNMKEVRLVLNNYLSNPLVRYSFKVYRPKSFGEWAFKKLLEMRFYRVLSFYLSKCQKSF